MTSQCRNALWGLAHGPVINPGALGKALHVILALLCDQGKLQALSHSEPQFPHLHNRIGKVPT